MNLKSLGESVVVCVIGGGFSVWLGQVAWRCMEEPSFNFSHDFSSPERPHWPQIIGTLTLGPTQPSVQSVMLCAYLHLVPSLRMNAGIPPRALHVFIGCVGTALQYTR